MSRTLTVDDADFDALAARVAALEAGAGGGASLRAFPGGHIQLFGPTQRSDLFLGPPALWHFPGAALSASTKRFRFDLGYAPVREARFVVEWTANADVNVIRVVHADSGPSNIGEMGRIKGKSIASPRPGSVDITALFNTLIVNRVMKHIGYQIWTDGVVPWTPYDIHLEVNP